MGRRCFSSKVVESDAFYGLPASAQALYLHLCVQADDHGFVNNALAVTKFIRNGEQSLHKLVKAGFLMAVNGIYIIRHWRVSNTLKNDRQRLPLDRAAAQQLYIKPDKVYTLEPQKEDVPLLESIGILWNPLESNGIPNTTQQNLTEENRREENTTGQAPGVFQKLWEKYPQERRGDRQEALEAFRALLPQEQTQAAESLKKWKSSQLWKEKGGRFIPFLSNWLSRGHWRSLPQEIPKGASGELGEAELEAIYQVMNMKEVM